MTREQAEEAGARALFERDRRADEPTWDQAVAEGWGVVDLVRDDARVILDAVGWVEPVGDFAPGQVVHKPRGYRFTGPVVAAFAKVTGEVRYVVENSDGMLHIFSGAQLAAGEAAPVSPTVPVGYVVAHEDHSPPGLIYPAAHPDLAGALGWAVPGERVWGLVPVEGAIELGANEGGA